jgi:hypothetical protein
MKTIVIIGAIALAACLAVAASQAVAAPQVPVPADTRALDGLSDLNAMTFSCPKAGLNAAARKAAEVPSQGTYQFSYFRIVNDTHHAAYEIHFKSNYEGESELHYCVEMYCQQGWDPKTAKTSITLMSTQRGGVTTHGASCGVHMPPPVKRRVK